MRLSDRVRHTGSNGRWLDARAVTGVWLRLTSGKTRVETLAPIIKGAVTAAGIQRIWKARRRRWQRWRPLDLATPSLLRREPVARRRADYFLPPRGCRVGTDFPAPRARCEQTQ
jgi:hypothetical protein